MCECQQLLFFKMLEPISKYQSPSKLILRRSRKRLQLFGSFLRKHFVSVTRFVLWIVILIGLISLVWNVFTSSKLSISEVEVRVDEVAKIYDQKLESYLVKDFSDMSKVMLPWYEMRFRKFYMQLYPWIEEMKFATEGRKLIITVVWDEPRMYIIIDNWTFWLLDNTLFRISNKLGSGVVATIEVVSSQVSAQTGFDSLFFRLSPDALSKQVGLVHENISDYQSLLYIPGASKLIMNIKWGSQIYFDLSKNMIEQLDKYRLISWSGNLLSPYSKIDIGTMGDSVFLRK